MLSELVKSIENVTALMVGVQSEMAELRKQMKEHADRCIEHDKQESEKLAVMFARLESRDAEFERRIARLEKALE